MKRLGPFLVVVLSLLAACVTLSSRPNSGNPPGAVPTSGDARPVGWVGVGRSGPDGAPLAAASPATPPVATPAIIAQLVTAPLIADRGIGGTGAPPAAAPPADRTADRGIGGTGIVGVVTGFGSVFVNGMEIQYDDSASVDVDGNVAPASVLRAGQLVAIQAEGPATAPHASKISVQSAVTGRIEALELGSGTLTIAGQAVAVPDGTWGANHFGLGDWVKVSGLRRADGTVVASRLDPAPAGVLLARGQVVREGEVTRVGNLVLGAPMAAGLKPGQFVIISGDYATGRGRVGTVVADTLFADPAAFFGPSANLLIVQAFVAVDKGSLSMNGVKVNAASVVAGHARQDSIAIVSLERGPGGSYVAVGLRYADYRGHTGRPFQGSSGAGAGDSSQVPQRNRHITAAMSQQAYGSDSGTAANGQVATAAAIGDPNPVAGPSASAQGMSFVKGPATIVPDPPVTSTPVTPMPVTVTPTPVTPTPVTPTPVTPLTTKPIIERVPPNSDPRGQLISGNAGHGTTGPLRSLNLAVHPLVAPPAVRRLGAAAIKGSNSTGTINLLTGAVTSVTTTNTGTAPARGNATTGAAPSLSLSTVGKSSPTIGATHDKPSTADGSGSSKH